MSQLNIFYNTTSETGDTLKKSRITAGKQNDKVLSFFQRHPDKEFSPVDVWRVVFDSKTPLTSCRRCMTTLEQQGYLVKTNNKVAGMYGKNNFTWRLNKL